MHGTAIACAGRAVLIRGPSGSGKSDLALRCLALGPSSLIADPVRLISDDQVRLTVRPDGLYASAPPSIAGLLEIRGVGPRHVPACPHETRLTLVADLLSGDASQPERLPDPWPTAAVLGVELPLLRLAPFHASAPIKLLMTLLNADLPPGV